MFTGIHRFFIRPKVITIQDAIKLAQELQSHQADITYPNQVNMVPSDDPKTVFVTPAIADQQLNTLAGPPNPPAPTKPVYDPAIQAGLDQLNAAVNQRDVKMDIINRKLGN